MKKNNTQLTTKKEKKLRRRLKFMVWVCKTFTKEKVMAAVCGISLGLSVALSMISFTHANLLGGFGFQLASLWAIGTWTAFLVSEESKKVFFFFFFITLIARYSASAFLEKSS